MTARYNRLYEEPAYGVSEAAMYLKVPYNTLRYWLTGFSKRPAIVEPIEKEWQSITRDFSDSTLSLCSQAPQNQRRWKSIPWSVLENPLSQEPASPLL